MQKLYIYSKKIKNFYIKIKKYQKITQKKIFENFPYRKKPKIFIYIDKNLKNPYKKYKKFKNFP